MLENKEKHPSYGMLQFSRTSGGATALFGSSIQHKDTIRMYLREGEVSRELNRDFYFGNNEIVEVEMSYSQFAEVITSMNQGTGVPVTIKYIQGKGRIEDCPFVDKKKQFEDEFSDNLDRANEKVNDLLESVSKLFEEKKSFTKKDKEEILNKIRMLSMETNGNREFIYQQFNEQMDKTTVEAKGEIEAFCQNKINSIANAALVEHKDDLLKLKNPVDIGGKIS
jgi:hypothetical protein